MAYRFFTEKEKAMGFIDGLVHAFREQYSELSSEWERHFSGDQVLFGVVCILATAYVIQDYEIGGGASPAECEERWIESGGPARFFRDFGWKVSAVQRPRLHAAWNEFQYLLLHSNHAHQIRCDLGHFPSEEELLNDEWQKWADRLRRRFQPILEQCQESVD